MHNVRTTYLLWLFVLLGMGGVHRIYNRKFASGILWLLTGGLFGIGQLIDLILIPDMVEEYNVRAQMRLGISPYGVPLYRAQVQEVVKEKPPAEPPKPTPEQIMLRLLKAAQLRGGKLSVTQAVLDTELSFQEVENTLKAMMKTGYVAIANDPKTGVVVYDFLEL